MNITDTLDRAVKSARSMKEQKVAAATREDPSTDIHAIVEGWRGKHPAVVIFPKDLGRDESLHAAKIAAIGFGCDVIAMTTEGWRATQEKDPRTGRHWAPGAMQDAVHNDQGREKGWITEGLTTTVVNRAGDLAWADQGYTVDRKQNALGLVSFDLTWEDEIHRAVHGEDGAQLGGVMIEQVLAYMNEKTMDVLGHEEGIRAEDFGLDYEEARAHMDCALVKNLVRIGFEGAVLLTADNDVRREIIDKSLKGLPGTWHGGRS